uniref:Protein MB21D1 n=1 Tax=Zeugodacus cucurbitae TaxID=28588 RepID=A0A0A1XGE6_ZEUCU
MAPIYEQYLQFIAQKITVRDEDRAVYVKDFDIIRDHILNGMCKVDPVFKNLYRGPSLFGSYSNNVRIKYPSEFDVIFKLSVSSFINVEEDEDRPGFVNLDFEDVMDELYECNGYTDVYNRLYELVDRDNGYLRRSNLQYWLRDVMQDCLEKYGDRVRGNWGDIYTLMYSKRGLAHTIYAKCDQRVISIDFVPGLCFGTADWIDVRHCRKFKNKCEQWYAVPKPTTGPKESRRYAFMMLETLASDFAEGWLPYFWNRNLNLLDNLHDDEIEDYADKLQRAYTTLRQYKTEPNLSYKRCETHFELP